MGYPIDPLISLLGGGVNRDGRRPWEQVGMTHTGWRKLVARARCRGGLTPAMADRLATAAGYHPENIWPGFSIDPHPAQGLALPVSEVAS